MVWLAILAVAMGKLLLGGSEPNCLKCLGLGLGLGLDVPAPGKNVR